MKSFGVLKSYKAARKEYSAYVLAASGKKSLFGPSPEKLKKRYTKNAQAAYDSLDSLVKHFERILATTKKLSAENGQPLETSESEAYLSTIKKYRQEMEVILKTPEEVKDGSLERV